MPTQTWTNLPEPRRDRVLAAAVAEFGRHGYSGGSLNVIAQEAGVAKGSLFQYFTDKFDFFLHVTEHTALRVRAALDPWLERLDPGAGFAETVLDAVQAWMAHFADHPADRGMIAAINLELDPAIRAVVLGPVHQRYREALLPHFARAQEHGTLSAGADLDALLALFLLLLPHLALAPFEPGIDGALGLHGRPMAELRAQAARLIRPVLAGFGVAGQTG
ncbi:TetR/AcrR family transcriptional regulator [Crossiella sp. SN42]|uniref:TetR/AcrR family transcriptional regulator n=1 Tax=Crossiella sp. SN42 TaxID=2944808 RepID=UPI00207C6386|nr:TetR/AcrR family transcriptional regulator [Crossiella sp. SN42]MCO1579749.1 TetR/AcrR family transcriptional regulator [Crossiella sp. SN42]